MFFKISILNLVKVKNHFENTLQEDGGLSSPVTRESLEHVVVMRSYCSLVDKIDNASCSVGKDGKFQLFICFAARYSSFCIYVYIQHLVLTNYYVFFYLYLYDMKHCGTFSYLLPHFLIYKRDIFTVMLKNNMHSRLKGMMIFDNSKLKIRQIIS